MSAIGSPNRLLTSLVGMEKWAERIKSLLDADKRLTQSGLAEACGIKQPSVSQWFGSKDKKPTEMIRGDNLLAAARYLNTSPEWIITGRKPPQSQVLELDAGILSSAIVSVKEALSDFELELDAFVAAPLIAFAYRERVQYPREMTHAEYRAFDAMIRTKLAGEMGNARPRRRASEKGQGSPEAVATEAPQARRRAAGR